MSSHPEILALKRELVREILASVGHLNRIIAADLVGIDEPRMSDIYHGRVARFSVERLVRMLAMIDRRVTVSVSPRPAQGIAASRILRERRTAHFNALADELYAEWVATHEVE